MPPTESKPVSPHPPIATERRRVLAQGAALASLALWPSAWSATPSTPQSTQAFTGLLRQGGCALLIRHAQTEPGTGDPPGFRLGECNSQRLLSLAGREQARLMGQWFQKRRLVPAEVLSSQWCRCRDTAELAFGRAREWPALNSTFGDASLQPAQTQALRERLQTIAARQFEVWVTHQVNMTHLTDEYPAMGEAFVVNRKGRVVARHVFA